MQKFIIHYSGPNGRRTPGALPGAARPGLPAIILGGLVLAGLALVAFFALSVVIVVVAIGVTALLLRHIARRIAAKFTGSRTAPPAQRDDGRVNVRVVEHKDDLPPEM